MGKLSRRLGVLLMLALTPGIGVADELSWPREIEAESRKITIYQPQIESFDGDSLQARAAVSVSALEGDPAPVFGAVWVDARVDTDRGARVVHLRELTIPVVRFPEASEAERDKLAELLQKAGSDWDISFSLDRLIADLGIDGTERSTPGLKHEPPRILRSTEPAVLITIDGEPIFQKLENVRSSDLERVVNTPFLIVRDASGVSYLSAGGSLWYRAEAVEGPWSVATSVPMEVAALAPEPDQIEGDPPKIIVATEPTELVVSAGEPSWAPVEGMDLLYMDNTDSDAFLDIAGQAYYVMLSGRWYRAPAVEGELSWEHVPNDELPEPFSDIPADSANGAVLAHVAGTVEAHEASLDNTIPQTAAIKRDEASLELTYDGDPKFEPVQDTPGVHYAINTSASVFRVADVYYACDQGAWYRGSSPKGPWTVATNVPDAIYNIPPSNPHHNVTYVYVYESTPEVVYVGYTPGYTGSYHYHGCVVYGTGWWYRPWWGHYYYPRPSTWGFRVSYNPYYGWGFGISWSNGPFSISIGRGMGGYGGAWFGVGGYRPYPRPYVGVGFRKTNINANINRNINISGGDRPGRPGGGDRPGRPGGGERPGRPSGSLYDRPQNRDRVAARPASSDRQRPSVASGRENNVLADRNGNVYRRQDGQWQQRSGNQWQRAEGLDRAGGRGGSQRPSGGGRSPSTGQRRPSTRPSQPSASGSRGWSGGGSRGGSATRPQLERDHRARQRGNQRAGGYAAGRSAGPRGGGRRR